MKQFESYEQATFKHTNPTTTSDGALMVEIGPPVHRFFFFFTVCTCITFVQISNIEYCFRMTYSYCILLLPLRINIMNIILYLL